MSKLSGPAFHALGVTGWVHLVDRIATRIQTNDWALGARLVQQIAEAADAQDHHPDLDLRYGYLDVTMNSHDSGGVTKRDVRLAQTIAELAATAQVQLAPQLRQRVEWGLDTDQGERLKPFWNAVIGQPLDASSDSDEVPDPSGQLPTLWFQRPEEDSGQRFHPDIWVHPDEVELRIAAALKAGGELVSEQWAPEFWVLADPAGNRMCLCTWQERH